MNQAVIRKIFRWIHIAFSIPIIGYIYDSPSDTPHYASAIRFVFVPVIVLSGLWMWKGHVVRRFVLRGSPSKTIGIGTGQEFGA